MRAAGLPYHKTVERVIVISILEVWLYLKCFWIGLSAYAKSMFCAFPLQGLFSILREAEHARILLKERDLFFHYMNNPAFSEQLKDD